MPNPEPSWSSLEPEAVSAAVGPEWSVTLLPTVASTNAEAARDPVPGRLVVADHQTAGRGRLDRAWETPPGTALTFSAVVDPELADSDWPLLSLAAALAVADGVRRAADLDPLLKWPNDLLLSNDLTDGKFAGILLERVPHPAAAGHAVAVIGIGVNVGMTRDQLPVPTATSLALAGATVDRTAVLGAVVDALSRVLRQLADDPGAVLARYRAACTTVGQLVEVHLPDGEVFTGRAEDLDAHGRLVVDGRSVSAGDVIHVRPGVT